MAKDGFIVGDRLIVQIGRKKNSQSISLKKEEEEIKDGIANSSNKTDNKRPLVKRQ